MNQEVKDILNQGSKLFVLEYAKTMGNVNPKHEILNPNKLII